MHELEIADQIIKAAKLKAGEKDISKIIVEVGDLGHIGVEEMQEVLKNIASFEVEVISKKAKVKCVCGYEGEPEILEKEHGYTWFCCPKCKTKPEVLEGEDILLKEVITK